MIVLASLGLAALFTATQDKVYAADANGFVVTGEADNPALSSVNDSLAKSRAANYVSLATSRNTAQRVIEDLGLSSSPAQLAQQISVEQIPDTVLIQITAKAGSPQAAQDLADAWVDALAAEVKGIEDPQGRERGGTPQLLPVEKAALPTTPVSPVPMRNLAIGLAVGLLIAFGYSMLRNALDRRLRTKDDVERLGVNVVGTVPSASVLKRDGDERATLAIDQTDTRSSAGPASEAFRKLRTNLMFMNVDSPPRVVVVTSPMPSDGKSTVAVNLAATIASSGAPVVLIDGDMRRPSVATEFGLPEGVGLSDVLAGRIGIDEALQNTDDHDNLSILAAGSIPPNPSELLGSQSMRKLLSTLSSRSMVVVDAPPLIPVTDAAVLTTQADGAFIVISSGKTLDSQLEAALSSLKAVDAKPLGVILNRMSRRDAGSSYYGDYYGYTSRDKAPGRRRAKK